MDLYAAVNRSGLEPWWLDVDEETGHPIIETEELAEAGPMVYLCDARMGDPSPVFEDLEIPAILLRIGTKEPAPPAKSIRVDIATVGCYVRGMVGEGHTLMQELRGSGPWGFNERPAGSHVSDIRTQPFRHVRVKNAKRVLAQLDSWLEHRESLVWDSSDPLMCPQGAKKAKKFRGTRITLDSHKLSMLKYSTYHKLLADIEDMKDLP